MTMVREERFEGDDAFRCGECGLHYTERETAERCEAFCREQGACSTAIVQAAVERQE